MNTAERLHIILTKCKFVGCTDLVTFHAVLFTSVGDTITDSVPPVCGAGGVRLQGLLQEFLLLGGPRGRVCPRLSHLLLSNTCRCGYLYEIPHTNFLFYIFFLKQLLINITLFIIRLLVVGN